MFMLMCLLLLCCSESSEEDEIVGHSKNLNFLIISEDLLLVQRLLLYGASFAKRMIVYSPMSELFASCSRDPFGFDTCMINAGCIPLATGGVCFIPNVSVLKKDLKDKLQNVLEKSSLTVNVPEKYWASQGQQLLLPLACSVWACAEPVDKTYQSQDCPALPRSLMDQFSIVLNSSGLKQLNEAEDILAQELLRKATEIADDEVPFYISDEEFSQFLLHAANSKAKLTGAAQDLIQGYYLASRRTKNSHTTSGLADFPVSAVRTLTSLATAHAKLALHPEVFEEDAVAAIALYEHSFKWKYGYSGLGVLDPPRLGSDASEFFGPKNETRMREIQGRIQRFCSTFQDARSTFLRPFHEE